MIDPTPSQAEDRPAIPRWATSLIFLLGAALISLAGYVYIRHIITVGTIPATEPVTLEELGQIGDSFGSVNAVIGWLSVAMLTFTVLMQSIQLAMQRHELGLQRKEMRESREALQDQARHAALQVRGTVAQIRAQALAGKLRSLEEQARHSMSHTKVIGDMEDAVREIDWLAEKLEANIDDVEDRANASQS